MSRGYVELVVPVHGSHCRTHLAGVFPNYGSDCTCGARKAAEELQRQLSRLLFESRELIDMFGDILKSQTGRSDSWAGRVVKEIDELRAEQGWPADGFGGETLQGTNERKSG